MQPFREQAQQKDATDPLRSFRERFYLPPGVIYLDGNSLGLLSRDAEAAVKETLDAWRSLAVEGWTAAPSPWFTLAESLAAELAPLLGTDPQAVAITGSTTANLHQLLATLFHPTPQRSRILLDEPAFPSDRYAVESQLRLHGLDPEGCLVPVSAGADRLLSEEAIIKAMTGEVALAVLPSVSYTTGQRLDMPRLTAAARERGIIIGWDLAHSIGALPHALDDWGADFAFWCHYKYLNAGPGAVGGLYLNRRHHGTAPGLAGWWGANKQRQFDMSPRFLPAEGAGALQIGTPPILALAPLQGTLAIHKEAGIEPIRAKSLALTGFLRELSEHILTKWGVRCLTPAESERRGGHIALCHPHADALGDALRRTGVVPDYRPPDMLRLAPVALYTSFTECLQAVETLAGILEEGSYAETGPFRSGPIP